MKLLLRCRSDLVNYENMSGLTARDIAQNNGHQLCIELVCACCCLLEMKCNGSFIKLLPFYLPLL